MKFHNIKRPTLNNVVKLDNHSSVIGTTAYLESTSQKNSAARLLMGTQQSQQTLEPAKPDIPWILTGGETELAKYTFDDIMQCNAIVIAKIPFYFSARQKDVPFTLIYRVEETGEIDYMDVTPYIQNHTIFGNRKHFTPRVRSLEPGDILIKGERLTKTGTIQLEDLYTSTVNANVIFCSDPESTEDGFRVTPEFIERTVPLAIGDVTASYGSKSFPINVYGNEVNPRAFPTQGERIRQDGLAFCIREYGDWDWLMTHKSQLNKPDRVFDVCMHAEPGAEVIDVDVLTTTMEPKRPVTNPETSAPLNVEVTRKLEYSKRMISQYTRIKQEANVVISLPLMRKFANCTLAAPNSPDIMSLLPQDERIKIKQLASEKRLRKFIRTQKNAELDEWTVNIKYAWRFPVVKGAKYANRAGNKGVVCCITEQKDMFTDEFGVVADMSVFFKSTISRMNPGQLDLHAIGGSLRAAQVRMREMVKDGKIQEAFDFIVGLYEIVAPVTHDAVMELVTTPELVKEHVMCCINADVLPVTILPHETHLVDEMYMALWEYCPPMVGKIHFTNYRGEKEYLRKPGLIAPIPFGILEKTKHNDLAENTAQLQHHGLPTSSSTKAEHPSGIKQHAAKVFSETEARMMSNVVGSIPVAQIMEMANCPEVSEESAGNFFAREKPLSHDSTVDRVNRPMGGNSAQSLIEHKLMVAGVGIEGNDAESLSKSIGWNKR